MRDKKLIYETNETVAGCLEGTNSEEDSIFTSGDLSALATFAKKTCGKVDSDELMDWFSDEEMKEMAVDGGEDGVTTFDAAMLVNVEG